MFVDCHWCRYLSCGNYLELWRFWASRYQEVCRYINWLARLLTLKTLLVYYQLAITKIPILNIRNVYIYTAFIYININWFAHHASVRFGPTPSYIFLEYCDPSSQHLNLSTDGWSGIKSQSVYSTWLMSTLSMLIMRILLIIIIVGIHIQKF